jgi:omega-6 fatty acid desaturase (delta-12 desaturase)
MRLLARYREPHAGRSIFEIAITAAPFLGLSALALITVKFGIWWGLIATVPAAFFLVRLFLIQHDCGHGSFFRSQTANDWVGRVLGVFTWTPYDYWRKTHAIHHAGSGNLDRRSLGEVELLTVDEYMAKPVFQRFLYRVYRNPVVMFGLGPAYLFVVQHRVPIGLMKQGWRPWLSAMLTNAGIAVAAGLLIWGVGVVPFLVVQAITILLAATIGVWLFYVQHQFDGAHFSRSDTWSHETAALSGSSHYDLPGFLRWITANIGIHHVHHVSSRIPYYRLPQVLKENPELDAAPRLTLWKSFTTVRLALWDEASQRLVSFRQARKRRREQA